MKRSWRRLGGTSWKPGSFSSSLWRWSEISNRDECWRLGVRIPSDISFGVVWRRSKTLDFRGGAKSPGMVSAAPGGGACYITFKTQSISKSCNNTLLADYPAYRAGTDYHTRSASFGWSGRAIIPLACSLRSRWKLRIVWCLAPRIIYRCTGRCRGALVRGCRLLLMNSQSGLILGVGVFFLGGFVRVFRPRQLLMLGTSISFGPGPAVYSWSIRGVARKGEGEKKKTPNSPLSV